MLLLLFRFWAVLKNAACLYGLRESIIQYLAERKFAIDATANKTENNLTATIRGLSCINLKKEDRDINRKLMLAELRCLTAINFAVMMPCLLVSATMKQCDSQRKYVRMMQNYFKLLMESREECRKLITYQEDGRPLTFLPRAELDAIATGLSEGHAIAYKRLCQPAGDDEIVIDMIQMAAAQMSKTQLNMSADLILDEARERVDKPADNIAAERSFGFLGFRKHLAWNENLVRTNGIMLWRLNEVSAWLASKTEEERVTLINVVTGKKFRQAILRRHKIREQAIEDSKQAAQAEWLAAGQLKLQQKAAMLKDQDTWTLQDLEGRLALYDNAKRKVAAMKQQWQHLKAWAGRGKLEFPFSRQPEGGTLGVWMAAMQTLLEHPKTLAIAVFKASCQEQATPAELRVIEDVKALDVGAADANTLVSWMQEVLNSADTDVHRSRKHRRDEEAAAAERGEVRAGPARAPQLALVQAGNVSAHISQESDDDVRILIRDDVNPEHLIMWSEAAAGEVLVE